MKIVKKILTLAIDVVSIISLINVPVSSAVLNPYNRDPNGDGDINIADCVYILQYLAGNFEPIDLEQLDLDDNGIISQMDSQICQLIESEGEIS